MTISSSASPETSSASIAWIREPFVGSDAVDWLKSRHGLAVGEAEAIGQRLVDIGAIYHVADEHGFSDAGYYYRFRSDEVA